MSNTNNYISDKVVILKAFNAYRMAKKAGKERLATLISEKYNLRNPEHALKKISIKEQIDKVLNEIQELGMQFTEIRINPLALTELSIECGITKWLTKYNGLIVEPDELLPCEFIIR